MKSISIEAIRKAHAALENEDETGVYYSYYGIRFGEDKARQVGDLRVQRQSRPTSDFPEYGTPETR